MDSNFKPILLYHVTHDKPSTNLSSWRVFNATRILLAHHNRHHHRGLRLSTRVIRGERRKSSQQLNYHHQYLVAVRCV